MKDAAVIVFPGSNCDRDALHVLTDVVGLSAAFHWYDEPLNDQYRSVILPGGFSYGDYLRAGVLAKISRSVESLAPFIEKGGLVLGICNGFQILVEAGFLPGALLRNESLHFQCEDVHVRVESNRSRFLAGLRPESVLRMPIAHAEGRYFVDETTLARLEKNHQVALRYVSPRGELAPEFNANGSVSSIAGVTNESGNVLGMMPHPERCSEEILGNTDGLAIFRSLAAQL